MFDLKNYRATKAKGSTRMWKEITENKTLKCICAVPLMLPYNLVYFRGRDPTPTGNQGKASQKIKRNRNRMRTKQEI
jgi:hypothetical protein